MVHGLLDNSSLLSNVYYLGLLGWSVRSTGGDAGEPMWRRAVVTVGIGQDLAYKDLTEGFMQSVLSAANTAVVMC